MLSRDYHQDRFQVLCNDVADEQEALAVFNKLTRVTDRFLNVSLNFLGFLPHDRNVTQAVRMQRPFCEAFPDGPAACGMRALARQVAALEHDPLRSDLGLLLRILLVRQDPSRITATA